MQHLGHLHWRQWKVFQVFQPLFTPQGFNSDSCWRSFHSFGFLDGQVFKLEGKCFTGERPGQWEESVMIQTCRGKFFVEEPPTG